MGDTSDTCRTTTTLYTERYDETTLSGEGEERHKGEEEGEIKNKGNTRDV